MKILVLGGGGREHALVWKFAQSPRVERIFCVPGNPGIAALAECHALPLAGDFTPLIEFARAEGIDLIFVGPEQPLVDGATDALEAAGLRVCGPSKAAAQLEGSKIFAKDFMLRHGIPTGAAAYFTESAPALDYLHGLEPPYVIKAFGLAAGKGAIVAPDLDEAERAVRAMLDEAAFGEAGSRILIEEYLAGEEASMLAFTDGKTVRPMSSAQDHKPIGEGDTGPNTGGMGAYSPAPVVTPALEREILETVLEPAVRGMAEEGIPYKGVLYAGLMIGADGRPRVIEFNCRFGDPETQPLLMRLETDLADVAEAIVEERLDTLALEWSPDPAVCVVMAAQGYPGPYEKGRPIEGLEGLDGPDRVVFHAGTARDDDGRLVTAGGRVLGVTARAPHLPEAVARAYETCDAIRFQGATLRRDIARKALDRLEG